MPCLPSLLAISSLSRLRLFVGFFTTPVLPLASPVFLFSEPPPVVVQSFCGFHDPNSGVDHFSGLVSISLVPRLFFPLTILLTSKRCPPIGLWLALLCCVRLLARSSVGTETRGGPPFLFLSCMCTLLNLPPHFRKVTVQSVDSHA